MAPSREFLSNCIPLAPSPFASKGLSVLSPLRLTPLALCSFQRARTLLPFQTIFPPYPGRPSERSVFPPPYIISPSSRPPCVFLLLARHDFLNLLVDAPNDHFRDRDCPPIFAARRPLVLRVDFPFQACGKSGRLPPTSLIPLFNPTSLELLTYFWPLGL